MKNLLKKNLPYKFFNYLSYLRNWHHNLYSFRSNINLNDNLSDFFVWSNECSQIEFVAENIRALISGEEIEVEHNFRFFNEEGEFITMQKYQSANFFEKIILQNPKGKGKYFSFTHFVESVTSIENIFKANKIYEFKDICVQNRGYTTYFPGDSKSGGATVHGNFGAISKNDQMRAKINLKKHIYTPIYKFKNDDNYDLVFNNPTKDNIKIKIIINDLGKPMICIYLLLGQNFLT